MAGSGNCPESRPNFGILQGFLSIPPLSQGWRNRDPEALPRGPRNPSYRFLNFGPFAQYLKVPILDVRNLFVWLFLPYPWTLMGIPVNHKMVPKSHSKMGIQRDFAVLLHRAIVIERVIIH